MPTYALWVAQGRDRDVPPPPKPEVRIIHAVKDGRTHVLQVTLLEVH